MVGSGGKEKIHSILYVYLPLGEKIKIFPSGIVYLANYIRCISPETRQHILDLSILDRKVRKNALRMAIRDFNPDLLAFSWRHLRYFGSSLYNEDLKEMEYCSTKSLRHLFMFLFEGFFRWKEYVAGVMENIGYIRMARAATTGALVLVGGSGFSVFKKDLLKRLPKEVIGVTGEGEPFLADLINNTSLFRRRSVDVKKEIRAIDYDYISSIFAGHEGYFGTTIGVQTNRGCGESCIYCPDSARGGRDVVSRSPVAVIQEISNLQKVFRTKDIWFTDRLVVSRSNVSDFAAILEEIVKNSMDISWSGYLRADVFTPDLARLIVRSGLQNFILPITSGSQRVIDALKLGFNVEDVLRGCRFLKDAGYGKVVNVELTLGVVEESGEDIKQTAEVYRHIKNIFSANNVQLTFNFCIVLPGSELEERLLKKRYFPAHYDAVSFNPLVIRKFSYMTPAMRKVFKDAYTWSYTTPSVSESSRGELILDFLVKNYRG